MIIQLKNTVTPNEVAAICAVLDAAGTEYRYVKNLQLLVAPKLKDAKLVSGKSYIDGLVHIDTPYQLASKAYKDITSFDVKGVSIGSDSFTMMAGPCSVENEKQVFETARLLSQCGIKFIRGGAYKPRTSPYSFRGLGLEGLKILKAAANQYDLRIVTEIMDLSLLDELYDYADILQVGSRNMQNFYMLNELGKTDKPVLLKRGMQAKVTEWLLAAEYMLSGGNEKVILCERGIRSFDPASRNVMDVAVIPLVQSLSHLPVIADPSHGTGSSAFVHALSLASVAAGANGLLIEVHPEPEKALSDSQQAIDFAQLENLCHALPNVLAATKKGSTEAVLNLQSL